MKTNTEDFRNDMLLLIGLLCFIVLAAMAITGIISANTSVGVHATPANVKPAFVVTPWCPEDAVPVGFGDFDGVTWDSYACIPRDDITPGGFRVGVS